MESILGSKRMVDRARDPGPLDHPRAFSYP